MRGRTSGKGVGVTSPQEQESEVAGSCLLNADGLDPPFVFVVGCAVVWLQSGRDLAEMTPSVLPPLVSMEHPCG